MSVSLSISISSGVVLLVGAITSTVPVLSSITLIGSEGLLSPSLSSLASLLLPEYSGEGLRNAGFGISVWWSANFTLLGFVMV